MKTALPLLAAGGTFAGSALAGLLAGILIAGRGGSQLWVFGGLLAGIALGGYSAFRMLVRSV